MCKYKLINSRILLALMVLILSAVRLWAIEDGGNSFHSDNFDLNSTNSSELLTHLQAEILNSTHANSFRDWLDLKSTELHELNLKFSGYKLLNETYNVELRPDAQFAYINFTDMIINISQSISHVLQKKSEIVKVLSEEVENAYDAFQRNDEEIIESVDHVYLDSKSPKTFCDLNEAFEANLKKKGGKMLASPADAPKKNKKRSALIMNHDFEDEDCTDENEDFEEINNVEELNKDQVFSEGKNRRDVVPLAAKSTRRKYVKTTTTTTTTTTSTTSTEASVSNDEDDEDDDYDDDEGEDDESQNPEEDSYEEVYWDVECINRTTDENFKSVQKVNKKQATIQVPTNVYKQDMEINMTAYWSDTLDDIFRENYEQDNELFWQYFCSSNGMFRRYPGAHWGVPAKEDFFDCRLQSWYIQAAASPKDVLILLDISGSMTGLRLEIGRRLIEFIMDTLTDNDFFNIITFSSNSQFLFNEPGYWNTFVQASNANKQKFKEKLQNYQNVSFQANVATALNQSFLLFNESNYTGSGCQCNKMIMIITDGQSNDVSSVFDMYNSDKSVRVFTYKIGRDMSDPTILSEMACNNNGEYYHVVTLTDINEHIFQYIPVLSRPMALQGVNSSTWSNVFIGYLDKELKIAVARPAFLNNTALLAKLIENTPKRNFFNETSSNSTIDLDIADSISANETQNEVINTGFEGRYDPENLRHRQAYKLLENQQVLLGVVGVDVPVLKLISKVSPKYQMGAGIYLIMIDNNGFIVYHPSIKQEIANSGLDSKGSSQSIDIEKFEIPILNDDEFDHLEHEMIDEMTGNITLENWKRDGLRVIRRRTEYVYTSVDDTPFSVAIASPSSFGRYYIDLPRDKEQYYNKKIEEIRKERRFGTNIQLYNCTYRFNTLSNHLVKIKENTPNDYCIRYLLQDLDQVLAIKSDLTLHNIYYNKFDFSVFSIHRNLVKSSFYGTYSGITFYLPVTFYKPKQDATTSTSSNVINNVSSKSADTNKSTTNSITTATSSSQPGSVQEVEMEAYNMSLNLFSTESNKHTYSFEKRYYTRSIEFSDYLRTAYNINDPVTIYFLNETSKESRSETISASLPIWLDKVPTSVAGVVYDAKLFKDLLFTTPPNCNDQESCMNICDKRSGINVTCFLLDEHGIIVLSNNNQTVLKEIVGQPLYKVNPWLMMQLELQGLYDLIVTGNKLQDCKSPPIALSSATRLFSFISFTFKTVAYVIFQFIHTMATSLLNASFTYASDSLTTTYAPIHLETTPPSTNNPQNAASSKYPIKNQVEWKIRNSHCFYFGIYSFNITKWQTKNSTELHVWCNASVPRRYMAGYVKHSNLLMLVVDDEYEVSKCGSIDEISKNRPLNWNARMFKATKAKSGLSNYSSRPEIINRYRKSPEKCYNYFPNESLIFKCSNSASHRLSGYFYFIATKYFIHLAVVYSFVLVLVFF